MRGGLLAHGEIDRRATLDVKDVYKQRETAEISVMHGKRHSGP